MLNQMPGGELQLQMLRNLSQAPSSFANQLCFYRTESLDYLLKAGSCKDFFNVLCYLFVGFIFHVNQNLFSIVCQEKFIIVLSGATTSPLHAV